ncbi:ferredoxin [Novosphingobium sp. KACC 22771]|uniref:ferredoxin n=1 Tax=Novosphingobium sp. KACC 22771 TaxID=3025670 RepID=UPI0023665E37|nr:ferredoxin [Novosphingobium sp. KACC 22771]WDF74323.1 ferredoxin [Novosphingobium sp. KACC 22771]
MKVHVNLSLCQGHARCEEICPEVFATDTVEGKCLILKDIVPDDLLEKARLVVRNCPEGALRLSRDKGAAAEGETA